MQTSNFKALIALLILAFGSSVQANEITQYWSKHDNNNRAFINHAVWGQFLQKYVNTKDDNKIRYQNVSADDKDGLEGYINNMQALNPLEYSRDEQYAYWVNLYNAYTIKLILDHYPVKSIKKIKLGKLFGSGPWKVKVMKVNGQDLSLDNIEHDILRPIWQTPLTHYAVNCASIGCPNLANKAFTAENTAVLLEQNAKAFINSDKGVTQDGKKIVLSKIYSWFKEDFGSTESNIIAHLKEYANAQTLQVLNQASPSVNYRYNWNLNSTNW